MKLSNTIVVLILLFLPQFLLAQSSASRDEILVTIPVASTVEAIRSTTSPLRVYHRLGDMYLAGTAKASLQALKKQGIDIVIVDENPWTTSYAVVAKPHPGIADVNVSEMAEKILFSGNDFLLIKSPSQAFERLQQRGFVCVEIERQEIPIDATETRLPTDVLRRYAFMSGTVDSMIALVSDTTIRNSIQSMQNFGTRYWSNANRESVSRWVKAQYVAAGITDVKLDSFQYNSTWQANVVATIPGIVDPSKELIVGGHHDSYSSNVNNAPGADDNATGTAAAIEMARVLKLANYQPAYTLRFMGFAAEEAGLRGSASYAQRARTANRDIRAMLNYDMIGNRTQSSADRDVSVVWYTGAEALSNLHVAVARAYTTLTPVLSTSSRTGSDSYSFWQQSYKSVFLIERDFSLYYHTANDLLQYLDIAYCRDIVRSGLATLLILDQMPPQVLGLRVRDCGSGTSVMATWDSSSVLDFATYKVYVGRQPGAYDTSYTQTSRSREITGLTQGVRCIVGVSIVDIAGREGMITEVSGIPFIVPQRPVGVTFHWTMSGPKLQWRKNAEMDFRGYNIYRRMLPSVTFSRLNPNPIEDTTFVDVTLTDATRRYFITAIDSLGNEGASSDTLQVYPPLSVDGVGGVSPFKFMLHHNYPNPFNPSTQIKYEIDSRSLVELKVFDLLGREVAVLVNEVKSAGVFVASWNAQTFASGVYYTRLTANGRTATSRMIMMK